MPIVQHNHSPSNRRRFLEEYPKNYYLLEVRFLPRSFSQSTVEQYFSLFFPVIYAFAEHSKSHYCVWYLLIDSLEGANTIIEHCDQRVLPMCSMAIRVSFSSTKCVRSRPSPFDSSRETSYLSNAGMSPSSASSDNDVHCGDCIPGDDSIYIPGDDPIYIPGDDPFFIPGDDLFCPHGNDSFNFHQSEGHSFDSSPDSSLSETLPLSSYGATMNSVYVPCEQPRSSLVDYSSGHAEGPKGSNLFVFHLPKSIADADLKTLFSPFGTIVSAKVFVDKRSGLSKGFGFVSYDSPVAAQKAIHWMNGFFIDDKLLRVELKKPKAPRRDRRSLSVFEYCS